VLVLVLVLVLVGSRTAATHCSRPKPSNGAPVFAAALEDRAWLPGLSEYEYEYEYEHE
jgi:hypothetical protein